MNLIAHIHSIKSVESEEQYGDGRLIFKNADGSMIVVYMPPSVAEAMTEAYHDATEAHENAAEQQALEIQAAGMGGNGITDFASHCIRQAGRGHLLGLKTEDGYNG